MSTIPLTSGTCWCSIASMPCRRVTSAMPHPWHPPPIRTITTRSCTSISSTTPPCRATIGLTWVSNSWATRSYSASSSAGAPAAGSRGATAGARAESAPRMAAPTDRPRGSTARDGGARRGAHLASRAHHVPERRQRLGPSPRLEAAVRVHPDLVIVEHFPHPIERHHDLLGTRHARRVNVVDTRTDLIRILVFPERVQELGPGPRALDGDRIGVHALDHADDVVEFAVAHVGVDLRLVLHPGGRQAERVDRPILVRGPVHPPQRQAFDAFRLVDLNHADPRRLEVAHLVPDRERQLLRRLRARLVVAYKRPLQDRHRPGQHSLHRLRRLRLRERAPPYRHRPRSGHVAEDDRGLHVARAVRLHPAMLREREALELLAEVLHHVVALELAVHQHVEPDLLLEAERLADLLFDERLVGGRRQLAVVQLPPRSPHFGGLGERADRRRRIGRERQLLAAPRRVRGGPAQVTLRHPRRAALDRRIVDPRRRSPAGDGPRVRL